jgi:hypothetical protein
MRDLPKLRPPPLALIRTDMRWPLSQDTVPSPDAVL